MGHFRSLHWCPCSLSCINEYLAIDSGGNASGLALARNCCLARMLPGEAELVSEWTGLPGEAKSVKHFERSNGLDTALYKNYLYLYRYLPCFRDASFCYALCVQFRQLFRNGFISCFQCFNVSFSRVFPIFHFPQRGFHFPCHYWWYVLGVCSYCYTLVAVI